MNTFVPKKNVFAGSSSSLLCEGSFVHRDPSYNGRILWRGGFTGLQVAILVWKTKERSGRPTKYDDRELETALDEDPTQTQTQLKNTFGNIWPSICQCLKALGTIRKTGSQVPHELQPRDIELVKPCDQLLQRHNRKGFLHRIVTGDEKGVYYDKSKRKVTYVYPGHASSSTPKRNLHGAKVLCIWWDQLGVVYHEVLEPNEIITGDFYRRQLSRSLKGKRPQYTTRHDKIILLHNNARPHVAAPVRNYL